MRKVGAGLQGSVTYNDVHVHGGKWSASNIYQDGVESPFTDDRQAMQAGSVEDIRRLNQGTVDRDQQNLTAQQYMNPETSLPNRKVQEHFHGQKLGVLSSPPPSVAGVHEQGEVTKTTFTSREHMEMHLSTKLKYKCGKQSIGHPLSQAEYSSIYPSRDFIERTTRPMSEEQPQVEVYPRNVQSHNRSLEDAHRYNPNHDSCRPIKKRRISKYSTDDIKVPPQMPLFDDMMQKYAQTATREEAHGSRHKYFVVNPSEITNMPPKALITKYIDFLIVENEQITDISKSVNPPVDIYVTEDMYFMDSLKYQVPWPSKKLVEWVSNFYPKLNFFSMKFKGKYPTVPMKGSLMKADPRPTQQILEDTFYYFQRELMNLKS